MPAVGFGCWKVNNDTAADQIYNAIKVGYRLFDGAQDYGNEVEVGQGIRRAIDEGLVSRQELFITSKLWNTYHEPKNAAAALERTLKDLGLDYVDLFLIHFPIALKFVAFEEKYPAALPPAGSYEYENVSLLDTWRAMESFSKAGKAKSIGISNFSGGQIWDLLTKVEIKPAVLQIEHHPYLQQPKLIKYVQDQGIRITGYSSFGPQSFLELDHPAALLAGSLLEHDAVSAIAKKHDKSSAQVLLRWAVQRGVAVIPKSNNPDRLYQNLTVENFNLTDAELAEIAKLDIGLRFNDPWGWDEIPTFH